MGRCALRERPRHAPGPIDAVSRKPATGRILLRIEVRYKARRGSIELMARNYERIVPIGRLAVDAATSDSHLAREKAGKPGDREGVA